MLQGVRVDGVYFAAYDSGFVRYASLDPWNYVTYLSSFRCGGDGVAKVLATLTSLRAVIVPEDADLGTDECNARFFIPS
jgi:hypothetical protein